MLSSALRALPGLALGLLFAVPASAEWVAEAGELGRPAERILIFAGANYGVASGSEIDDSEPGAGVEAGAGYRIWRGLVLTGSWAYDAVDVDGQLVHLLDVRVRQDGRSGLVQGQVETNRYRGGLRFTPVSMEGWRYHPYLEAGVVFSTIDVTIDQVDGRVPIPFLQTPDDEEPTDIRTFDDSQVGFMMRFAVEADVARDFGVDVGATVEIIELPPGTHSFTSASARLFYRL